jgi:ribosomal protein S18 acetylase RimI-like enzyme
MILINKETVTMTYEVTHTPSGFIFTHPHGHARADFLEGTEEILHFNSSYVLSDHRDKGLGALYHKERLDHFLTNDCVKMFTCVVNKKNEAQVKILKRNGWTFGFEVESYYGNTLIFCNRPNKEFTFEYDKDQQGDKEDDI